MGTKFLRSKLLWRAADEKEWRRSSMALLNNDRWQAALRPTASAATSSPSKLGDKYGTLCRDLKSSTTRAQTSRSRSPRAGSSSNKPARERRRRNQVIASAIAWLERRQRRGRQRYPLLAQDLREVMRETEERRFLCRREPPFASKWKGRRPASAPGTSCSRVRRPTMPARHGTFDDVIHACRRSATWASTCSIYRRSIRSAHQSQGQEQQS